MSVEVKILVDMNTGKLMLLTCSIIAPFKKRFRFASVLSKLFGIDFVLVWLVTILL